MGSIPKLSVVRGGCTEAPPASFRLHTLFENNAKSHPQHTALVFPDGKGKTWEETYEGVSRWSNRLCRALLERVGASRPNADGDYIVAVRVRPGQHLLPVLLAVWKAGAAYLPIDIDAPPHRVKHILQEASPVLLVTEAQDDSWLESAGKRVALETLEEESLECQDDAVIKEEMLPSNSPVAIVLYTSGSTGVPKGVRVRHTSVLNRLEWQWSEFPYLDDEDTLVFKTATTFVDSVGEMWGPLLHPGRPRTLLVLPKELSKDPQRLSKLLTQYKIQRLVLVPTLLRSILMFMSLSKKSGMLDSLMLWVCSGETLTVSLAQQFLDTFPGEGRRLCNFYGSTEVMGDVTYHVIASHEDLNYHGKVPIGMALSNTTVYLLDTGLQPVGQGEVGELFAAGRNLAAGYVNNRDPHRFLPNHLTVDPESKVLYRTGDYGRLIKGVIVFEGRTDSQVKVRGHRVDLSEVEAAVSKLSGVKKAVVLCHAPGEMNQAIVSFILPEDNTELFEKDLELNLQSFLQSYAMPQIVLIDNLPLLINGKVDRQSLLKHYEQLCYEGEGAGLEVDLTGLAVEKRPAGEVLFRTIASVLGTRGTITAEANFYRLGGNSLNSVYTVTLLREANYHICISDFIAAKNLGEIVDKMKLEEDKSALRQSSNKHSYEMLNNAHKSDVFRVISDSFYSKADLERWIVPAIKKQDYLDLLEALWPHLVAKNCSYVVKNEEDRVIGASLNFDAHDEPDIEVTSGLSIVFAFLEYLEGPIRDRKLPQGKGKVFHSFMMGTGAELTPGQNVEVMEYMEMTNLRVAKTHGFTGVFTTNTSPLTQQLGRDVFNYTCLHTYRVNQFVASDRTRPFKDAPDDQVVICQWKLL